jgi:hypothetical protein
MTAMASNGAEGSSFLSLIAANNASSVEFWVDDESTLASGPELDDFYNAVAAAAYSGEQITHVVWSQEESDALRIANGTITKVQYKADLEWLFDNFRENFPNLQAIVIMPIGPRTVSSPGTQQAREVQQEVAAAAADVLLAAEVYDQPLSDSMHYTEAAYTEIGERLANILLRDLGETIIHASGPEVTGVNLSGATITLTVTHDGGTTLNGYSGTPVDATASSGDNFFRCFDGNGIEIPISAVSVTTANQITITLAFQPIANFTLYGGYRAMEGVTDTDTFITDGTLPLRTFNTAITADLTNLATSVVSIFSAEVDPNNASVVRYFNNAAGSGADAWTKVHGAADVVRQLEHGACHPRHVFRRLDQHEAPCGSCPDGFERLHPVHCGHARP